MKSTSVIVVYIGYIEKIQGMKLRIRLEDMSFFDKGSMKYN